MNGGIKKSAITLRSILILTWLIGIGLGVALHFAAVPSANSSASLNTAHRKGSRFVFADLDGDRIPDLALVEMQTQRSANSDYAIRVRLSAGAESAIGVRGPIGGLRVTARDVNGDDNLDLIVTADLDAGFIKVLLNDGHGNFSAVAPSEFLQKETETDVAIRVPARMQHDHSMLAPVRCSYGESDIQSSAYDQALSSEVCGQPAVRPVLQREVLLRLGRSPPLVVSCS